jgi:hypothetical protein
MPSEESLQTHAAKKSLVILEFKKNPSDYLDLIATCFSIGNKLWGEMTTPPGRAKTERLWGPTRLLPLG